MSADDMVIHGNVDMLSKVLYARGRCDIGQVCIMSLCLLSAHCLFNPAQQQLMCSNDFPALS